MVQFTSSRLEVTILVYAKMAVGVFLCTSLVVRAAARDMTGGVVAFVVIAMLWLGMAGYFFSKMSAVNSKFMRLPTMLNGMDLGMEIDFSKSWVADYILTALSTSSCGFLVFNVVVTRQTILKTFYYSCAFFMVTLSQLTELDQ
mmetsp:Transcript_21793/g.47820  ORF Transcript_21793/g.47820 Transcript_21793/m.47820 type:complete len:144 (+) Transcript_21793:3-434(+)